MKSLILILTFLTRIPIPYSFEFNENDFKKGIQWAPAIGFVIGLIMALFSYFMRDYLSNEILGFIIFLLYISITGGLHIDGLVDSLDGLYSSRKKDRILEIMKDSRVGTFGALGLVVYVLGFVLLAGNLPWEVIFLMPIFGRLTMLQVAACGNYARKEGGMGKSIIEYITIKKWILNLFINIAIISLIGTMYRPHMLVKILVSYSLTMAIMYWNTENIIKKIDGITGDILGYSVEISQLIFMMISVIVFGVII